MKKEYGLKYIEIVENVLNKLDEGRTIDGALLASFTVEFWSGSSQAILAYLSAPPEARAKTRQLLNRQKELIKGLKNES